MNYVCTSAFGVNGLGQAQVLLVLGGGLRVFNLEVVEGVCV